MSKPGKVVAPGLPDDGRGQAGQQLKGLQTAPEQISEPAAQEVAVPTVSADIARFALDRLGVTQTVLAERIGVSQSYISRVLGGEKNFAVQHLEKLAGALEMPLAVMIWQATPRHKPKDPRELEVSSRVDELIRWAYPEQFRPEPEEGLGEPRPGRPIAAPRPKSDADDASPWPAAKRHGEGSK